MLKSLTWKITLAFMVVAFTTAALVALFIRLTSADRLMQLIMEQQRNSLDQNLSTYYSSNGSWDGVAQEWGVLQSRTLSVSAVSPADRPTPGNQPPVGGDRRNLFGLADAQGVVIVSVDPAYPDGAVLPANIIKADTAILVDGKPVGTILTAGQPPGLNPQEALFLQRTNQALLLAMGVALLVALVMGILLARTLTGPLQALTQAARGMTRGQEEQQVKVRSNDEIGQLAEAFNHMSEEVARVNQLRRKMTADIAHDLRTPLTVISGYIESMRDGVLKPTPQRLALIYVEIERLQNLVGDLKMLSQADAGELPLNPQWISPKNLLDRAASLFRHQAGQQNVSIQANAEGDIPNIWVDEARMMQVLDNLISNALRYTPEGGKVTLWAGRSADGVEISIQDTGSGIEASELPYIFDRFHRAESSRHTETGESGLGLAIVKAIVESHGGSVSAESTPGKGTTIRLLLPVKS